MAGAFETTLRAFVADLRGPAAAKVVADAHRGLHDRVLGEQARRGGIAPGFRHTVDGRPNVPFEQVRPGGRIVTLYDYRREIALFALAALRAASPVQSGRYRNAHFILLDGQEVESLPAEIRDDAIITVTNSAPYARRLEVGKKNDGSPFVVQVEPRIYQRIAKQVVGTRYRNVAAIAFNYVDLANAYRLRGNQRKRQIVRRKRDGGAARWYVQPGQSRDRSAGQPVRYPAIIITPL